MHRRVIVSAAVLAAASGCIVAFALAHGSGKPHCADFSPRVWRLAPVGSSTRRHQAALLARCQLYRGRSTRTVRRLLGRPIAVDRVGRTGQSWVYSIGPDDLNIDEEILDLEFRHGRLRSIDIEQT